jgi:hypothetical protein
MGSHLDKTLKVNADACIPPPTADEILLDLASRMDSDGGMPGKNRESRAIATVIAVLAFLSQGLLVWRDGFKVKLDL